MILGTNLVVLCQSGALCVPLCQQLEHAAEHQKQNSCCRGLLIGKHIALIGNQKHGHPKQNEWKCIGHQPHHSHQCPADASTHTASKAQAAYHQDNGSCDQHKNHDLCLETAGYGLLGIYIFPGGRPSGGFLFARDIPFGG